MSWLDLTVKGHYPTFAKRMKAMDLRAQLLMKVERWDSFVVRVDGCEFALKNFLFSHFDEAWIAEMHVKAMKHGDPGVLESPKNRALKENRSAATT